MAKATKTTSKVYLQESLLNSTDGTLDDLYKKWLKPYHTKEGGYISKAEATTEEAIYDGFKRFCDQKGGKTTKKRHSYYASNNIFECKDNNQELIGKFKLKRKARSLYLRVDFDSPLKIKKRKENQRAFDTMEKLNGAKGWIKNREGKFRFLRAGTLHNRHIVVVKIKETGREIPLDNIVLLSAQNENSALLNLQNGEVLDTQGITIERKMQPLENSSKLNFVILDTTTNEPYTVSFKNSDKINFIRISPKSKWLNLPSTIIESKFTEKHTKLHQKKIRNDIAKISRSAIKKGWDNLIPKDSKIPPAILEKISRGLAWYARKCNRLGYTTDQTDIDETITCKIAKKERKLVSKGYPLSTKSTPLAVRLMLEAIREDATGEYYLYGW